ncbi:unnamed protein product [Clonostachys rhizophaga]|uniref:Glucose receptor Git3 N-terminal domain-containing protein n=1 Tax=Clonostachys rhizophaga TaxID=160324 RepID=A0A9N9V6P1_9HYPO|nr:unnamed protein product [Clonostachys rhizophaga]
MAETKIDYVIAIPTFIGSLLSFLASAVAIILQIARPPRRHFRHALIVNLLISDCINSLENTISGAIFLYLGYTLSDTTPPSAACIASGYINQLSVQTIDFNILIISIIVLVSIVKSDLIARISTTNQILVCVAAWVPALITSHVALGLNAYGYVSGNWCWIKASRVDLRYGLTHGWRLFIFFATIIIYSYIYIRLQQTFKSLRTFGGTTNTQPSRDVGGNLGSDTEHILVSHDITVTHELQDTSQSRFHGLHNNSSQGIKSPTDNSFEVSRPTLESVSGPHYASHMPAPPNVKKMLLMNGYPLAYIILWIPGIANRLAESTGQSPRWLKALQASTQYVGLVNSLTYGISEQMRQEVWKKLKGPSSSYGHQ